MISHTLASHNKYKNEGREDRREDGESSSVQGVNMVQVHTSKMTTEDYKSALSGGLHPETTKNNEGVHIETGKYRRRSSQQKEIKK